MGETAESKHWRAAAMAGFGEYFANHTGVAEIAASSFAMLGDAAFIGLRG